MPITNSAILKYKHRIEDLSQEKMRNQGLGLDLEYELKISSMLIYLYEQSLMQFILDANKSGVSISRMVELTGKSEQWIREVIRIN